MFNNQKFLTCGVMAEIPSWLIHLMWHMVLTMVVEEKDYLQVFTLTKLPTGFMRRISSRMTRIRSASIASMSTTSAAMTAAALFIATARTGTEMTTPTAHPAGMSTARSSTNTATHQTLFSTAKVCVISAWSSKSMTAAR